MLSLIEFEQQTLNRQAMQSILCAGGRFVNDGNSFIFRITQISFDGWRSLGGHEILRGDSD